jgi:hypothetical protein
MYLHILRRRRYYGALVALTLAFSQAAVSAEKTAMTPAAIGVPAKTEPVAAGLNSAPQANSSEINSVHTQAVPLPAEPVDAAHQPVNITSEDKNGIKYVVGKIDIDEEPDKVWKVVCNPYEFKGKICHNLKKVDMLTDKPEVSVMSMTYGLFFPIPDIKYVVESRYHGHRTIDFQRVSGSFHDFRGCWHLDGTDNDKHCLLTYSMYLDPGLPLPDWLVRFGLRHELPSMLRSIKQRVDDLKSADCQKVEHTTQAGNDTVAQVLPSIPVGPMTTGHN